MTKVALTIAGSDSGGGAGIQADLRTFAFHCIHGTSAITCVTSQNTLGVTDVLAVSSKMVNSQLATVASDIKIDAVKTGMLLNQEIIKTVADFVRQSTINKLVVDPVMVSRTGAQLIDDAAIATLKQQLLPLAAIITPNIYEAQILAQQEIKDLAEMKQAAKKIQQQLGVKVVLLKGGGLAVEDSAEDLWFDGNQYELLTQPRVNTKNTHGTGCTLSAAIAANLALGMELFPAVTKAKAYVTTALQYSLDIGSGHGPVGHFFSLLRSEGGNF